jgi:hypothetical protein
MPEAALGIIKSVLAFRLFLLHGLECVHTEWSRVTVAWNIKRMFALRPAQKKVRGESLLPGNRALTAKPGRRVATCGVRGRQHFGPSGMVSAPLQNSPKVPTEISPGGLT